MQVKKILGKIYFEDFAPIFFWFFGHKRKLKS